MSEPGRKFDAAAICALPFARRAYMALVTGLAVFIVTLVVLREPFRGYLTEVRLSGPAVEGLDLDDAMAWLKQADSRTVIVATAAGQRSPRSQIRMTYLAPLPTPAISRLDELATRWLYQYLPERLNAFRHAELADLRSALAAARAGEDAAQSEVESLRQRQLALIFRPAASEQPAMKPAELREAPVFTTAPPPPTSEASRERLETLRLELSKLLASFTDEHPQVITIRSQIEMIQQRAHAQEQPLPQPAIGPELIPAPRADRHAAASDAIRPAVAKSFVSTRANESPSGDTQVDSVGELSTAVTAAIARLAVASRQRQTAEHQLSDRMQELSGEPTAAEWAAEPAHIVTRLGGTPRCATLALGGLLAAIGGIVMFRGAAVVVMPPRIESPGELASALEIPVVGNVASLRRAAARIHRRVFTAGRVQALGHLAEAIVGIAVLACMLSIVMEPSLARQVFADPFGTLSEVIGRFG